MPTKKRTVVMRLVLETHYAVELDENGISDRHNTKDLREMARYDASLFANGELELDSFIKDVCTGANLMIEPVAVEETGNA